MRPLDSRKPLIVGACLLVAMLLASRSTAAPIYYSGTGHYYDFIRSPGITWTEANQHAPTHTYLGAQGYLATITSQGENDLLFQTFGHTFWEAWLGGWQEDNSAPATNWHWVTDELWAYTNWAPGEPNDSGGVERYLQMWGVGTTAPGRWNDDANDTNLGNIGGFFVEYEGLPPPEPIPEPATLSLTGIGLGIAAWSRLHRRARK